ncbi:MAG: phosphoribosylformylglycinamidine synthase subunit PurL, partial [Thaumarchaeota archaeon]
MISAGLQLGLSKEEVAFARASLGREPSETEWAVIDAEWSEHNSYKSSKGLLKLFPTTGKRVVLGPGYDAGVVDVGGGYVATIHIESHNHPSAVDPYGGSSTGIGGVLRDILSMG